jgi:hypothetical protein
MPIYRPTFRPPRIYIDNIKYSNQSYYGKGRGKAKGLASKQGMHFLQIHTQTVEGHEYLKKIRNLRTHVLSYIQSL